MLRSCYSTEIRPYYDSETTVKIRWFFADDASVPLPFPTRFGSGNWASERAGWEGVGEVLGAPRPYAKSANPLGLLGDHECGSADMFLAGAPLSSAVPWNGPGPRPDCLKGCIGDGPLAALTSGVLWHSVVTGFNWVADVKWVQQFGGKWTAEVANLTLGGSFPPLRLDRSVALEMVWDGTAPPVVTYTWNGEPTQVFNVDTYTPFPPFVFQGSRTPAGSGEVDDPGSTMSIIVSSP